MTPKIAPTLWLLLVAALLSACGGGGSDVGNGGGNPSGTAPTAGNPPPDSPPASPPPVVQPPPSSIPETTLAFTGPAEQPTMPVIAAAKLAVPAAAMVYDKWRNQLIVSAALSSTSVGLVALSPADLSVLWAVATSSPATVLTISDDGSQLYAGLFYESAIEQFDLRSRSPVRKFSLGASDPRFGAFDIAVRPGSPQTIAVSIGHVLLIPTFVELALFVDGVRQPRHLVSDFTFGRASQIEFVDSSTIVGFDNETSGYQLWTIAVVADGLMATAPRGSIFCCFDATLTAADGRLFVSSGNFLDATTLKVTKRISGPPRQMFHPGTDSVLHLFRDTETFSRAPITLFILEYDVARGYLKRRFRVDEALPGADTTSGQFFVDVVTAVPTGASSFAVLVQDQVSGATAILAYDLASIDPIPPRTFPAKSVAGGSVMALSIPLASYALAYDPARDRLAAIVPPGVGPQGNSVAIIRPGDGVIEHLVPLSSEPRDISVSQTGSKAYVNLPFESSIQQVDLETGALGWKARIDYPPGDSIGFIAKSIAVKPDDPDTIVIAGCGSAFCNRSFFVFRNGQLAFEGASGYSLEGPSVISSAIAFNGASEILGFDLETTDATLQRFVLGASGLQLVSATPSLLDIDPSVPPKVGHGFVYGRSYLVDLQANRRVGRLTPGSRDHPFFEQTLLLSESSGIGYYRPFSVGAGDPRTEYYELLTKTVKPDRTLEFSGTSRIRLTDTRVHVGPMGPPLQLGPTRFAQVFVGGHGTGVVYVISTP